MSQDYKYSVSWYSVRVMVGIFWLLLVLIWVPKLWGVTISGIHLFASGAMAVMALIAVVGVTSQGKLDSPKGCDAPDEEVILCVDNMWKGIQYHSLVVGTHHILITPGGPARKTTLKDLCRDRRAGCLIAFEDITSLRLEKHLTEGRIIIETVAGSETLSLPRRKCDWLETELKGMPVIWQQMSKLKDDEVVASVA